MTQAFVRGQDCPYRHGTPQGAQQGAHAAGGQLLQQGEVPLRHPQGRAFPPAVPSGGQCCSGELRSLDGDIFTQRTWRELSSSVGVGSCKQAQSAFHLEHGNQFAMSTYLCAQ